MANDDTSPAAGTGPAAGEPLDLDAVEFRYLAYVAAEADPGVTTAGLLQVARKVLADVPQVLELARRKARAGHMRSRYWPTEAGIAAVDELSRRAGGGTDVEPTEGNQS